MYIYTRIHMYIYPYIHISIHTSSSYAYTHTRARTHKYIYSIKLLRIVLNYISPIISSSYSSITAAEGSDKSQHLLTLLLNTNKTTIRSFRIQKKKELRFSYERGIELNRSKRFAD